MHKVISDIDTILDQSQVLYKPMQVEQCKNFICLVECVPSSYVKFFGTVFTYLYTLKI